MRYKYGDVSSLVFTNKSLCASLPRMAVSASEAVDKDERSSKAKKEEPNLIYADLFWHSLGILWIIDVQPFITESHVHHRPIDFGAGLIASTIRARLAPSLLDCFCIVLVDPHMQLVYTPPRWNKLGSGGACVRPYSSPSTSILEVIVVYIVYKASLSLVKFLYRVVWGTPLYFIYGNGLCGYIYNISILLDRFISIRPHLKRFK